MLGRLLFGIVKGLFVGGLVAFAMTQVGFVAPGTFFAYASAALTGVLIGLIAGKPIWAKDAKIEAGMKAFFGALLGAGLMYALRRFGTMAVPFPLGPLAEANTSLGEAAGSSGTVGGLAITSLPLVAGLLGGFYEADNDAPAAPEPKGRVAADKMRIADAGAGGDADEELESDEPQGRAKK